MADNPWRLVQDVLDQLALQYMRDFLEGDGQQHAAEVHLLLRARAGDADALNSVLFNAE